jgi:hypothetical protein
MEGIGPRPGRRIYPQRRLPMSARGAAVNATRISPPAGVAAPGHRPAGER